jgi:CelD/BcsL family acetyltransferase involved in cellulose biosynthesis
VNELAAPRGSLTQRVGTPGVELADSLEPLEGDWTRLAAASDNIFSTWEWNDLWWRHYGRGRRLRVAVSRQADGEIDAIAPLFVWSSRPLRILRLVGHGHGDHLGPICRDDDAETAVRTLGLALDAEPYDVFVGDWVAGDRDWAGILGGRVVRRTGYPILRRPDGGWDELLGRQSQRFRQKLRYSRNRIERDHSVSYRYADSATLERDLDAAFHLHRVRFGDHACNFCGSHEAFQREFAALALERDWLRLLILEIDGNPVGCKYGFFFQNAYFAYQSGRDPAWERESIGFLLEVESIRRVLEQGGDYRFLGGEEGHKYRYPTEDPRLETIVAPATGRGRVAAAVLDALWRRLPGGKELLRRIGSARAAKLQRN